MTVDLDHTTFASAMVSMLESCCWTWLAAGGESVEGAQYDEQLAITTLAQIWQRAMLGSAAR